MRMMEVVGFSHLFFGGGGWCGQTFLECFPNMSNFPRRTLEVSFGSSGRSTIEKWRLEVLIACPL